MGPFDTVDNISQGDTGPIQDHRQCHQSVTLGPFVAIDSISLEGAGPIHDHRQHYHGATLGPFEAVGSNSQEECWAHSRPSAVSPRSSTGPI